MNLANVTLVAVSSVKLPQTISALTKSMVVMSYAQVLLISHERPVDLPLGITFKPCRQLRSIDAYNWFMVFELAKYIETDFALVIQHDGYVRNPDKWTNDFLNYDYLGAPWPANTFFDQSGTEVRVGNGGFSLRSKRLLGAFTALQLSFDADVTSFPSEDSVICVQHRKELEAYGIKFAPVELAASFSREFDYDANDPSSFGFHFHPAGHLSRLAAFKLSVKQGFKSSLKQLLPRPMINKLKSLFLENVRVSSSEFTEPKN